MNKPSALKIVTYIVLAFVFFFLGYYRNNVFVALNERMSCLYWHSAYPPLTGPLSIFESSSYSTLIVVKWIFTFGFTFVFALISAYTLRTIYGNWSYTKVCFAVYGAVFAVSLLFMVADRVIPGFNVHGYNIARNIMHLAQSPILAGIMLLGIYVYQKQQ